MSSRSLLAVLFCAVLPGCGGGGGAAPPPVPGPPAPPPATHAAQAGVDVLLGDTATAFRFFGQGADVDGGAVGYAWDFDGDGSDDSTAQSPQHTFATTGTHEVLLTVTDDAGGTRTAQLVVGVYDAPEPADPAVALHVWMLNGTAPCQVLCRATAADPDGGAIASYAWDFDSDGGVDASGPSATTVTTLPDAGVVRIHVTATDDEGAQSSAAATVWLCEAGAYPEGPPTAMIAVPGGTLVTSTNTPLDLVAVGSDLDGGSVASIDWDLDEDGSFDDASGRSVAPSFATEGSFRVRVRLTDDEGNAPHEAEVCVLVQDVAGPARPSAGAWAETLVAAAGTGVQFHGLGEDPADANLLFSWDLDGDGAEDAAAPDPVFAFALPGIYRPRLRVTDSDGNVSVSDLTLLVEACDDSSAPYFRYECADVLLLHGGAAQWTLAQAAGAGAPTSYQLVYKAGPPAEDPAANDLEVAADTGAQVPPATGLIPLPSAGDVPLDVVSLGVDAPPRLTCYAAGARLVDPGVRVQVLKCQACVVHDAVLAELIVLPLTDDYQGWLKVRVDPARVPGLQATLPDIYQVEILFADQVPALVEVGPPFFLATDWSEGAIPGGHGFSTTTNPIPPTTAERSWQFRYDTNAGPGRGAPLTSARIRLRDENGVLIGAQDVAVR